MNCEPGEPCQYPRCDCDSRPMRPFRSAQTTSFPYLRVARMMNVPYGLVLFYVDRLDECGLHGLRAKSFLDPPALEAICDAWCYEWHKRSFKTMGDYLRSRPEWVLYDAQDNSGRWPKQ